RDRERHDRKPVERTATVARFDVTGAQIFCGIQPANIGIKFGDDFFRDLFGAVGLRDDDEVVAADVADEVALRSAPAADFGRDTRDQLYGFVAVRESVDVVECFEIVEVEIKHREGFASVKTAPELAFNREISGKSREWGERRIDFDAANLSAN